MAHRCVISSGSSSTVFQRERDSLAMRMRVFACSGQQCEDGVCCNQESTEMSATQPAEFARALLSRVVCAASSVVLPLHLSCAASPLTFWLRVAVSRISGCARQPLGVHCEQAAARAGQPVASSAWRRSTSSSSAVVRSASAWLTNVTCSPRRILPPAPSVLCPNPKSSRTATSREKRTS